MHINRYMEVCEYEKCNCVSNLHVSYYGKEVLHDIGFTISEGEISWNYWTEWSREVHFA